MTADILSEHKIIWEEKPVLKAVYHDYYQRIKAYANPGRTLEVGGGTGNLKNYLQQVVSTDILPMPWLDAVCDGQSMPFNDNTFDNIIAVDVLHHIERPIRFFKEVERVLSSGGKLILMEPAITKVSWFFYHFFHPEPVMLGEDPLIDAPLDPNRKPFDANQAIPELLFGKYITIFNNTFPALTLTKKAYLSLWVYPLSGGFRKWCLIPRLFVNSMLRLEKLLENLIGKHIGFRLFLILEKQAPNEF